MKSGKNILLGHGSGGKLTHDLIGELFVKYFSNPILEEQTDSALLDPIADNLSFTTDSFVVDPIFFPGGDIGKLAVCGTVNDLAVSGALPLYLSAGFIIEEGFPLDDLERIAASMAAEAEKAGVRIVTGDTKVVNRGNCDKIFINTTGIGSLPEKYRGISPGKDVKPGDKIIINGPIGDHGMAIMAARKELNIQSDLVSDCASLNGLIRKALDASGNIRFMRDATRGGLGTVVSELVANKAYGIMIDEEALPVRDSVRGFCELLGFDPLYVANEGKVVMVVPGGEADTILKAMRSDEYGKESMLIGEVVTDHPGKCWLSTQVGGKRIIDMLAGEQLPRIC
jgi:hydrogenase expression/formation protein HypE